MHKKHSSTSPTQLLSSMAGKSISRAYLTTVEGDSGLLLCFDASRIFLTARDSYCFTVHQLSAFGSPKKGKPTRVAKLEGRTIRTCSALVNDGDDIILPFMEFDDREGLALTSGSCPLALFDTLPMGAATAPFEKLLTDACHVARPTHLQASIVEEEDSMLRTALHFATIKARPNLCEHLLSHGADPNARDVLSNTPLHYAAALGHVSCGRWLIAAGASLEAEDLQGRTPLYVAAELRNLSMAKLLLESGAAVDATSIGGSRPITEAAKRDFPAMIRLFLHHGARIHGDSSRQCSPLMVATNWGCTRSMKTLLKAGCDPNEEDDRQRTPLQALWLSSYPVARLLLAAGAEVNHRCREGRTALHYACETPSIPKRTLELLASAGAHLEALDVEGKSPLDLALERRNETALHFFRNSLGTPSSLPTRPSRQASASRCRNREQALFPVICQALREVRGRYSGRDLVDLFLIFPHEVLRASPSTDDDSRDLHLAILSSGAERAALLHGSKSLSGLSPWFELLGTQISMRVCLDANDVHRATLLLFNLFDTECGAIIRSHGFSLDVHGLTRGEP